MSNETKIESFEEAISLIDRYSHQSGFIFRGQSTVSWMLKASIYRIAELYVATGEHLERFKKYSVGRIDNIEKYSDKELWAIGQHFGLKTPLLDWTVSAAIALYFSFESKIENNENYAGFYAINANEINKEFCKRIGKLYKEKETLESVELADRSNEIIGKTLLDMFDRNPDADNHLIETEVTSEFIRIFSPKRFNNPRILAQRGLFSMTNSGKTHEQYLAECGLQSLCNKYLINISLKERIMKYLDSHNINQLALYPDVSGAALYANSKMNLFDEDVPGKEFKTDFWL